MLFLVSAVLSSRLGGLHCPVHSLSLHSFLVEHLKRKALRCFREGMIAAGQSGECCLARCAEVTVVKVNEGSQANINRWSDTARRLLAPSTLSSSSLQIGAADTYRDVLASIDGSAHSGHNTTGCDVLACPVCRKRPGPSCKI